MAARTHLDQYGVSMEEARNFIIAHLDNLQHILDVSLEYGVTNSMLAEIYGGVSSVDVVDYFTTHELDSTVLDGHSRILVGQQLREEINTQGEADSFSIVLNAGVTYSFTLESAEFDSPLLLTLLARDGSREKQDWFTQDIAGFGFTPEVSGTYYLEASHLDGGETGSYTIAAQIQEDDYGNHETFAGGVTVGASFSGEIEYFGDEDWFELELSAGIAYTFTIEGEGLNRGYLFISEQGKWGREEAGADFRFIPKTSGVYNLVAKASITSSTDIGTYTIITGYGPEDDYSSDVETLGVVSIDSSSSGNIEYVYDDDWFSVELNANDSYVFTMQSDELEKYGLILLSSEGRYLQHDHVSSNDSEARFSFVPSMSGTYFLDASDDLGGGTGTYTVGVSLELGDSSGYSKSLLPLAVNSDFSSNIKGGLEEDRLSVDLSEKDTLVVNVLNDDVPAFQLIDQFNAELINVSCCIDLSKEELTGIQIATSVDNNWFSILQGLGMEIERSSDILDIYHVVDTGVSDYDAGSYLIGVQLNDLDLS